MAVSSLLTVRGETFSRILSLVLAAVLDHRIGPAVTPRQPFGI